VAPCPSAAEIAPRADSVHRVLLLCFGNCLVTWAEITVPPALAAVIVGDLPLFVAALEACRKDGERVVNRASGLLIGFAGNAGPDGGRNSPAGAPRTRDTGESWRSGR